MAYRGEKGREGGGEQVMVGLGLWACASDQPK